MRLVKEPHKVKVYEKIKDGIWCYKGFFNLVDAKLIQTDNRKVFKFYLKPVEYITKKKQNELPHSRLIPTTVKLEVWARDTCPPLAERTMCSLRFKGKLTPCLPAGRFDHDPPYSKGGTLLTAENLRILCMKHNLRKSGKILSIPLFY